MGALVVMAKTGTARPERWMSLNPTHGPGIVLYLGEEYLPLSANVRAVPAWALFGGAQ